MWSARTTGRRGEAYRTRACSSRCTGCFSVEGIFLLETSTLGGDVAAQGHEFASSCSRSSLRAATGSTVAPIAVVS